MAVTVDSVIVELEAKIDRYNADVNAAHANFTNKMTAIERAGFKMGSGLRSAFSLASTAAVGFVGALGVQAILNVTKAGLDYAASLGEVAQFLGVSTQFLQEFRFAATQNGASVEGADTALAKYNNTLGKARDGNKQAVEAFAAFGPEVSKLVASGASSERVFLALADGASKINDTSLVASRSLAVFGQGASALIPTLSAGAAAFRKQADEARAFGLILTEGQIQNANVVADKIEKLNAALSARVAGVIADNANAIGQLAEQLAQLAIWAVKAGQQFIGFANIARSRGFLSALATVDGNELAKAATPGGRARLAQTNIKQARSQVERDRANLQAAVKANPNSPSVRFFTEQLNKSTGRLRAGRQELAQAGADARAMNAPIPASPELKIPASPELKSGGAVRGAGTGKAAGGSSGPSLAEIAARFNDDLLRAQSDVLSALEQMAVGIVDQSALQRERLENDRKAAVTQIEGNKDYTAAQKATLVAEVNKRAAIDADAINRRENEQLAREAVQITQAALANDADALQRALGMARSSSERRDIELRLLDIAYQREKAELEGVIASKTTTDAEKKIAAARLAKLGSLQAGDAANIERQNAGPLKSYLDGIPQTAAEVNDALEAIAANGLKSLNDGIADAIVNGKDLGSVFKSVASSIISDLIRIAVQQAVIKPLGGALGGLFGGGGIGTILGGLGGGIGGGIGRASGGDVAAGKLYRVNETGVEGFQAAQSGKIIPLGRMPKAASGGGGGVNLTVMVNANDAVLADTVRGWVADGINIASAQGAMGGAELAKRNNARRASRMLGRGGR